MHHNARTSPVVRYRPGRPGLPTARQTPVTTALIAINLGLFLIALGSPNLADNSAAWPAVMQDGGQWYRLFTSFFVTNNWLDVALNMYCLLIIGRLIEPALGPWRYLTLYMLAGLGGSVAYYLLANPLIGAAGASGAIFGLFGGYFVLARRARQNTQSIVTLIAINLVFSFIVPDIAWQAHVGGLVIGLAVAAGFALARGRRQELVIETLVSLCACAVLVLLMTLPPGAINLG